MMYDGKPSLSELAHYGVKGMKWGVRNATSEKIVTARRNLKNKKNDIVTAHDTARKTTTKGTAERAAADKRVDAMVRDFNKDPDRVIAARMTRGEKAALTMLAVPSFGGTLLPIAASSITSRRIQKKQASGKYDKK